MKDSVERDTPKVTIGMPVYNGERYLDIALASLLGQTYTDFELIISDNASTDRTRELCEAAARSDPRVRYVRQPHNIGAKANFYYVLREARGDHFMWAAHDDVREPKSVELLVAALDRSPTAVLASGRFDLIDEGGGRIREVDHDWNATFSHRKFRQLVNMMLLQGQEFANAVHIYGLMRRDAILNSALAMESVHVYSGFDVCILLDLLFQGDFVFVDDLLLHYRTVPPAAPSQRLLPRVGTEIAAAAVTKAWAVVRQFRRYHDAHFRSNAECFGGMRLAVRRYGPEIGAGRRMVLIGVTRYLQLQRAGAIFRSLIRLNLERLLQQRSGSGVSPASQRHS